MSQDPRSNHDSSLNNPVGDPGRNSQRKRRQGVDKGCAIKDGSNSDKIFENMHDGFCSIANEEMSGDGVADLFNCEIHGDISILVLILGFDIIFDNNSVTDLILDNVRRGHFFESSES